MALSPRLKRIRKSIAKWGDRRRDAVENWLGRQSLVESTELMSTKNFPWIAELEANWQVIRREMEAVMPNRAGLPALQDLSPLQNTITRDNVWKVFIFDAYGMKSEINRSRCPETAKLIDKIPDLEVAFFSVLEPGAHLTAHRGAYKGLIRTHLGLMVPEPNDKVRMNVGKETIHWHEGKCVLFDDTYRHEVWNDTDGVRVVLLIDVPRPFPPVLAAVNKTLLRLARLTPFVTDSVKKFRAWEKDYYAAEAERPAA
jgi:aspartyl/asparaginyl beta-hydroxylase (cupin superfamily)